MKYYPVLERIPLRFCKDMLGLPLSASNVAVYGETGTYPQWLRNFYRAIKYYVRIHTTAPCLVVDALELLKSTSGRNWNRSICEILRKYEPRQTTTASQINLQVFGQCLQEAFITKWTDDLWNDIRVSGGNKLRTYRTFKTVFAWEHYLSAVTNRSHLIALARFRTSCHGLQIEVGRYQSLLFHQNCVTAQYARAEELKMSVISFMIVNLWSSFGKICLAQHYNISLVSVQCLPQRKWSTFLSLTMFTL